MDIDKETQEELNSTLTKLRAERKPTTRGIMLLTSFLGSLMLRYGSISQENLDAVEIVFWITHHGDGTLIVAEHQTK